MDADFPEVEAYQPCTNPDEHLVTKVVRVVDEARVSTPYWDLIKQAFFVAVGLMLLVSAFKSLRRPKKDLKKKE